MHIGRQWKKQDGKIGSPSSCSPQRHLTICRPRYHYENSRKQLRYCSTLGDVRAKNSHTAVGEKSCFTLLMITPLSRWHHSTLEDDTLAYAFSPSGGRGVGCESSILAFWRAAWGTCICLTWLGAQTGSWHPLDAWQPLRTRESNAVCCYRTREHAVLQTDTRGSKRSWTPEKETNKPL